MNILARSVGRRKEAVAQVQIVKGTNEAPGGQFIINNLPAEQYLHNNTCSILSVKAPISILQSLFDGGENSKEFLPPNAEGESTDKTPTDEMNTGFSSAVSELKNFNTLVKVKGGGLVGQAEAIKLGLTRAICQLYGITPSNKNQSIKKFSSIESSIEESLKLQPTGMSSEATIELRKQFKDKGFLTQDSRVKERRKYGLKKARKASQYHKR